MTDSDNNIVNDAVQQFVNAKLQGQEIDLDEFVKGYPGYENQIRQKIEKIQRIDGLFSNLMEADDSDYTEPVAEHDLVGQTLGDFEILSLIGAGGMGAVFLARQTSLDREVALKVISDVGGARSKSLERFKREAKVLAKISHPNIVPVYEVGEQGPYSYFAMEHVQGISLDKILSSIRNAPTNEKASNVMKKCLENQAGIYDEEPSNAEGQRGAEIDTEYIVTISKTIINVASALGYAHEKGILHRDIKPSNIIIAYDGTPKLVDFGLAKAETQQTVTVSGEFFGTPSYVSPEQIRKPETVDCRSDVYSLAATYYECLTLHAPFEGSTINETLTSVISREAIPPKKYCPRLSADLNTVLLHSLEKAPEDRYQSASDFAADIQNVLDFKPITAKRPSITRRTYRAVRRHPFRITGILAGIMVLATGFALTSSYTKERKIAEAGRLYAEGMNRMMLQEDVVEAYKYFKQVLEKDPTHKDAALWLKTFSESATQLHTKEFVSPEEVIKVFEQAIQSDPSCFEIYLYLAQLYLELGRYEEAIKLCNRSLSVDPNHEYTYLIYIYLGIAYNNTKCQEEAMASLKKAISIEPNNVEAYNHLGLIYNKLGRHEEAIEVLKKAISVDPKKWFSFNNLGLVYNDSGHHEEAVAILKKAISLDPNNAMALYNLGRAYTGLFRHKEAIDAFTKSLDIDPNRADAYFCLSLNYKALQQYEDSISPLLAGLELKPNENVMRFLLARAYQVEGHYEDAMIAFRQYLDVEPNSTDAYVGLGDCSYMLGSYIKALEAYNQAIAIEPNNTAYSSIAWCYNKLERYQLAIEKAQDALRFDPKNADALGCIGASYNGLGQYGKAIEACIKAIEIESNYLEVYTHLSFAYRKLGLYKEAIRCLKQACESTDYKDHIYVAALASAYAESDDFDKAIDYQKKAIELVNDNSKKEYEKRLEAYQAHKPWRE